MELIEEEVPWLPEYGRLSRKTIVGIRVTASENSIQRQVRRVGGTWDVHHKVWHLPYEKVVELGLEDWILVSGNGGEHENLHLQ